MIDLRGRTIRWGLVTITAAAVAGLSGTAALAATPGGAAKTVTYRGYSFTIPANWPVIRTSASSTTCVRFDQHALYLGEPGRNQRCPNALLGTTEAILVQPAGPAAGASAAQDATARQITVVSPRIKVTATYADDQAAVTQILASASLPLPPVSLKTASPASPGIRRQQGAADPRAATGGAARGRLHRARERGQLHRPGLRRMHRAEFGVHERVEGRVALRRGGYLHRRRRARPATSRT